MSSLLHWSAYFEVFIYLFKELILDFLDSCLGYPFSSLLVSILILFPFFYLVLTSSSFPSILKWKLWSRFEVHSFLGWVLKGANFPTNTASVASHKFWCVVIIISSKHVLIIPMSSLIHELFRSMLTNFQIFEDFLGILLLSWFLLYSIWSEELAVSSVLGYLLLFTLAERWAAGWTWCSIDPLYPGGWQRCAYLSYLCCCLNWHTLSLPRGGVLKCLPLIVNLSVSLFLTVFLPHALGTCIIRCHTFRKDVIY